LEKDNMLTLVLEYDLKLLGRLVWSRFDHLNSRSGKVQCTNAFVNALVRQQRSWHNREIKFSKLIIVWFTKYRFNSYLWLLFGGESSSSIIYQNVVDWVYNGSKLWVMTIASPNGESKENNKRKANAINPEIEVVEFF